MLRRFVVTSFAALGVCAIPQAASAQDVLAPSSIIVAIHNTIAGGDSTASTPGTGAGQFPAGEAPRFAIDDNTGTKYLNFGAAGPSSATKGTGTGLLVTPAGGPSVVNTVLIQTANDAPERDPTAITIEGSNATGDDLTRGSSFTLLYSGPSGLDVNPGRRLPGLPITFPNTASFTSYRILTTAQRGVANSVQFSEISLFVPEPGSAMLLGIAGLGLLARRRRV